MDLPLGTKEMFDLWCIMYQGQIYQNRCLGLIKSV